MSTHAAAVSFWAMLSLVPLVAMVTFGVALFVDTATIDTFLDEASATVPGETVELVSSQVRVWAAVSARWSAGVLIIAVIAASWGASAAVAQLARAINIAHERPTRSYAKRRLTGLLRTIIALALVIPIVVLIAATPSALDAADVTPWVGWTIAVARWPLVVLLFTLLLSGLYWSAPAERERFHLITPGVVVAGLVFLIGSSGFALYASGADSYDKRYGSLATVVVTMLWLYVSNSAILLGAEVDAERAATRERQGPVDDHQD
jgi:membrane protein